MDKNRQIWRYILTDYLTASLVWFVFNVLRYYQQVVFRDTSTLSEFLVYPSVWIGQIVIPIFWMVIYYFSGYYNKPLAKSRISEFWLTLVSTAIGVFSIFMFLILNELPTRYQIYYYFFFELFGIHFLVTYIFRLRITSYLYKRIQRGDFATHVLILGVGERAKYLSDYLKHVGTKVLGFVRVKEEERESVPLKDIQGKLSELPSLMKDLEVEELVVATEVVEGADLSRLLYSLYLYKKPIKVWVDKKTFPFSKVRLKRISSVPLADISENNFSEAEQNIF